MTDNTSELKILRTNKVKSTSEQIPSDVDTDADYDEYSNGEPAKDKNKNGKSSNTSTNVQKQNSQYEPLEKHKKNRKTLYIICGILWFLIAVGLLLFLLYYFNIIDIPGLDTPTDTNTQNLPDRIETYEPSVTTTPIPTQAPSHSTMILRRGNQVTDQGITMNFPKDAFPDSWLKITISSATNDLKEIFSDTTAVFKAKNIDDISGNRIHFQVENNPLDIVPDITYKTSIPIPKDLLNITKCPSDYGYEIFTIVYQMEFDKSTYPAFALFPSEYTPQNQTLTTYLYPQMFNNKTADIILSCTPGTNIIPPSRRLVEASDFSGNPHWEQFCKASEIICPIENGECITLNPFSRSHDAVDYATVLNRKTLNVVAVANGIVERSETSITYGNVIVIRNEDGSATLYGGLQNRRKRVNDKVIQGEIIGLGAVNGHLHFEYIPNGEIYATKARINPNDCFPPPISPTNEGGNTPTKSPLVWPNTHAPTPAPVLATGSITVRDSGALADDSFAVYIDTYRVCETEIGELNTCPISFLRPGLHTLTLEVLVAPDEFGTFFVELSDGLQFTDGTTSKDAIKDYNTLTPPEGWTGSWNFTVPIKNELKNR